MPSCSGASSRSASTRTVEFLRGLAHRRSDAYAAGSRPTAWRLTPFATAVLVGILYLLIRRAFVRPVGLGTTVSVGIDRDRAVHRDADDHVPAHVRGSPTDTLAGRVNWWAHLLVILAFLALIPASKHFHLVLSPITVFLKSPVLGNLPNLDFEKEEVGLETVKDLKSKSVLDAFTCVECGRCQVNCPAWGAGKELNPKTIILQTQEALLAGDRDKKLADVYSEKVLWQCTTCGACENQCPVGIEHLPILIGVAPRPGVQRRRAGISRRDVQPSRAPEQHLGPWLRSAAEVRDVGRARDLRSARSTTCSSGSDAPARSRPISRSRCARCSRSCARAA